MKCSGENVILGGTFHVVSCFPLHFMLYRGNLDYFRTVQKSIAKCILHCLMRKLYLVLIVTILVSVPNERPIFAVKFMRVDPSTAIQQN